MKRLVLAVVLFPLALPAEARPASSALTCAAAAALVLREGAVVLDTSQTTFDRFVRDGSFCPHATVMRAGFVPTRDNRACFIGYTCEPQMPAFMQRN